MKTALKSHNQGENQKCTFLCNLLLTLSSILYIYICVLIAFSTTSTDAFIEEEKNIEIAKDFDY